MHGLSDLEIVHMLESVFGLVVLWNVLVCTSVCMFSALQKRKKRKKREREQSAPSFASFPLFFRFVSFNLGKKKKK